jgi:predicted HicB family RNase H-like nuclease
MNVNYEIPDDLHRALKVKAAQEGLTLKALIISLLSEALRIGELGGFNR